MSYPLVLDLAADGIPVAVTCRVLGFSKQAFYAWRQNPVPQRDWDEAQLINAALDIHADDPVLPGSATAEPAVDHSGAAADVQHRLAWLQLGFVRQGLHHAHVSSGAAP